MAITRQEMALRATLAQRVGKIAHNGNRKPVEGIFENEAGARTDTIVCLIKFKTL
jgi:hypothetical protein